MPTSLVILLLCGGVHLVLGTAFANYVPVNYTCFVLALVGLSFGLKRLAAVDMFVLLASFLIGWGVAISLRSAWDMRAPVALILFALFYLAPYFFVTRSPRPA